MTTPRFSTSPAWLAAAVRLATGASLVALALLATGAEMAFAQSKTTIEVLYPYPSLFKALHEELAKRFQAEHPQIEIRYRAPAEHYEDATQQMLRAAVAGNMPDVAYHGLNRVRIFVERGVAMPLDSFINAESDWAAQGHQPESASLGEVGGKVYGLPFAISTAIVYYNPDLVARAGGDPEAFPKEWDAIVELSRKIQALGGGVTGGWIDYGITGNWMFQSLVFADGGRMMDSAEQRIAFDGAEGLRALKVLQGFAEAGMPDLANAQALAAFAAGKLGILVTSTAYLGAVQNQVGEHFKVRTAAFPVPNQQGRLPAGGNVVMVFAKDPQKQKAAWQYVKFVTGPVAQTLMVQHTGYMPSNRIAIEGPEHLADFYRRNPNHMTSIRQLPRMTGWYAFPGRNALKVTDVIKDHMQTVVTRQATAEQALAAMSKDVRALLVEN